MDLNTLVRRWIVRSLLLQACDARTKMLLIFLERDTHRSKIWASTKLQISYYFYRFSFSAHIDRVAAGCWYPRAQNFLNYYNDESCHFPISDLIMSRGICSAIFPEIMSLLSLSGHFCTWLHLSGASFHFLQLQQTTSFETIQSGRWDDTQSSGKIRVSLGKCNSNDYFYISTFTLSQAHLIGPPSAHAHREKKNTKCEFVRRSSNIHHSLWCASLSKWMKNLHFAKGTTTGRFVFFEVFLVHACMFRRHFVPFKLWAIFNDVQEKKIYLVDDEKGPKRSSVCVHRIHTLRLKK